VFFSRRCGTPLATVRFNHPELCRAPPGSEKST
jgi:hypothetical protein